MRQAEQHSPAGSWAPEAASDSVTLDFDMRHRRRIRLVTDAGEPLLLNLPKAVALGEGDGLRTDRGEWILVRAAVEPLLEVTAEDRRHLTRLAWHVGNRHVPAEIGEEALRIRPDHVIAQMLEGLGGRVRSIEAPFQPERGAYAHGGDHAH